jgi:hypothetical protein
MKPAFRFIPLLVALALLSGCNLLNLLSFRSQLRESPPSYTRNAGTGQVVLKFHSPVLLEKNIKALGIPLRRKEANVALARYRIQVGEYPEEACDFVFRFSNAKLDAVELPSLLPEILGERNVRTLFRLAGGGDVTSGDFEDISPARVQSLLCEHYDFSGQLGLSLEITLRPEASECRNISIKLIRPNQASPFRDMVMSI